MSNHIQQCDELIRQLQAHKAPLDAARQAAWEQIAAIENEAQAKTESLRNQVKAAATVIAPIDRLLADLMAVRVAKTESLQKAAMADITTRIEALTNGNV